jgi:hypothetical protein
VINEGKEMNKRGLRVLVAMKRGQKRWSRLVSGLNEKKDERHAIQEDFPRSQSKTSNSSLTGSLDF